MKPGLSAFTLIELLIAVAIVAILAAIALPNFLEAQTRAKVSRVRAEQRTTALGIEVYAVDQNVPPPVFGPVPWVQFPWSTVPKKETLADRYHWITSPIAYLTSGPFPDPFVASGGGKLQPWQRYLAIFGEPGYSTTGFQGHNQATLYREQPWGAIKPLWVISSAGPDQDHEPMDPETATLGVQDYDPTNGSVSDGDIMRARGE